MNDVSQAAGQAEPHQGVIAQINALAAASTAVRNIRAIALLALTFVGAALIVAAFSALGMSTQMASIGALGGLLGLLTTFYGLNAVGIMMMREAQGTPVEKMSDAILVSLVTSHRVLAVFALECLIMLGAFLVLAAVLFVCKIPALGPFLYTFVFPISAILFGTLVFALFYVMLPLTGPAIWSGGTVFQVIARLNLIVRTRLIQVVLSQFFLYFMAGIVAMIIFGIVMTGMVMTSGMSMAILGSGGSLGGAGGIAAMLMGGGGGGSYAIAAGFGGGILMAIAAVLPALILTKGLCIIYLNTTHDLDFAASEAQLGDGLAAVRRRAEEARDRARALAEQQRPTPAGAAAAAGTSSASGLGSGLTSDMASTMPTMPPAAAGLTCPSCHAPVAVDDMFCGSCAHRLK